MSVHDPPNSGLVWRLGMTRGALVAVLILACACGWLFNASHAASVKNRALIRELQRQQAVLAIQSDQIATLAAEGAQAHEVACAQRRQLRIQVRNSIQYLADVRSRARVLIPGLTEADVLASIKRTQNLLMAFDQINC